MTTVAEALARLRDAGERLPERECPECLGTTRSNTGSRVSATRCITCDDGTISTGSVPSDLAKAVETATTVLRELVRVRRADDGYRLDWASHEDCPDAGKCLWAGQVEYEAGNCHGTGRVLRRAPGGEVPCPCTNPTKQVGEYLTSDGCPTCVLAGRHVAACERGCGGSSTVPGTDEASVVARLEACGLLRPVADVLGIMEIYYRLDRYDYPGALEAAAEGVEAVVALGVRG